MDFSSLRSLLVVLLVGGSAVSVAGCSTSGGTEAGKPVYNANGLIDLKDRLGDGIEYVDSDSATLKEGDRASVGDMLSGYVDAEVSPPKCKSVLMEPFPAGTNVSTLNVMYGDTTAGLSFTEVPDGHPFDIGKFSDCVRSVVTSDSISRSVTDNPNGDQQFSADGMETLSLISVESAPGSGSALRYEYRGWWDDTHMVSMTVGLVDESSGASSPAPEVDRGLDLLYRAVGAIRD